MEAGKDSEIYDVKLTFKALNLLTKSQSLQNQGTLRKFKFYIRRKIELPSTLYGDLELKNSYLHIAGIDGYFIVRMAEDSKLIATNYELWFSPTTKNPRKIAVRLTV